MAAPRLLEAVEQGLLVGLEEEHGWVEAALLELAEHPDQLLEVVSATDVGDDRGAAHAASLVAEELAEGADHPRGEVVDAKVAAVLERRDGLRLPGPRVAGDHHQVDVPRPVAARPLA